MYLQSPKNEAFCFKMVIITPQIKYAPPPSCCFFSFPGAESWLKFSNCETELLKNWLISNWCILIYIYIYMWQGPFGIMRPCDGYSTFFWYVEYAAYILSSLSVVRDERIVFPEATLFLLAFWIKLLGGGWTRFSYDGITCQVFSILVFFTCKLNCFSVGRIALGPMPIGNGIISSKTLV